MKYPEDGINLSGVIVGSPLVFPLLQRLAMSGIAKSLGLISGNQEGQLNHLRVKCVEASGGAPSSATELEACDQIKDFISDMSLVDVMNVQNVKEHGVDPFVLYLNGKYSADVFKALHVDTSPKTPKF